MSREVLREDYIPKLQECLVDPNILRNVYNFFEGKRPPSLAVVLDVFSLAEALVLFERLISSSDWRVSGDLEEIDISFLGSLSNKVVVKESLTAFSVDFGIPNDDAFDYALNFCWALDSRFSSQWRQLGASPVNRDFALEISDTLNLFHRAWKWRCNLVASPLWEMFFISEDRSISTQPKGLYDKLSTDLKKEIKKLQEMKYPILIYIPPIPAFALQRCKGEISNFWFIIEEIRKSFSSCRQKYAHYQDVIANPGKKSLGDLIQLRRDAISDVDEEINLLAKKRTDGRILMEIWDSVAKVSIEGEESEIAFNTGANITKLLSKSLNKIRSWIVQGRARSLFNIYRKTLSIRSYNQLIYKNFKLPKEKTEIQASILSNYSRDIEKATGTSPKRSWV